MMSHLAFHGRPKRTLRTQRGNLAVIAALALVPLSVGVAYSVEMAGISRIKSTLQAAVDAGALAGATEVGVASRGDDGIADSALRAARQQIEGQSDLQQTRFTPLVNRTGGTVTLQAALQYRPVLPVPGLSHPLIEVSATAETLQQAPLCVLQTGSVAGASGMKIDDQAIIRAPGCLVHANDDIDVLSSAVIQAGRIQASGTARGQMSPTGNSGAMPVPDPFDSLTLAPPTACSGTEPTIEVKGNATLNLPPGVHCGAIEVTGNATLNLMPGEHYFQNVLGFRGNSKLRGDDIVMIFGTDDSFMFDEKADVEITARRGGQFAGFLIATGRDNDETFTISSTSVRELLGTIYIPNAELMIATKANVAEESAWSVVVARALTMKESPTLVINSNYASSGVPVPEGVGPASGTPRLTR